MSDPSRPVTGYPAAGHPQSQPYNPNGYSTASTAYPYAAPPPHAAAFYNPNPYRPDPRATFLRRLFAVIIASIIIAGTIAFIIWLVLRPRIPDFRVDSVSVSNFNLSSSSSLISGNWDVRFTARNPNGKITLYYDHIDASVFYKSEALSQTTVPPFVQGKKNETSLRATFAASSAYVDKWVVDGINGDRARGSVSFVVRMVARVRFKASIWRTRRRFLRVYCGNLMVGLASSSSRGNLTDGSRQCRVRL